VVKLAQRSRRRGWWIVLGFASELTGTAVDWWGARSTGNANVAGSTTTNFAAANSSGMFPRCLIQVLDLHLQLGIRKPEEQNPSVSKALMEDQLFEIAISNDENPLLAQCNSEDVIIRKTKRVIARDRGHVGAEASKWAMRQNSAL
jgi:hypothetical protein